MRRQLTLATTARRATVTLLLLALCGIAAWLFWPAAETLRLGLPVDCDMATRCSIQNYVDSEPGRDRKDYRCGTLTYDGHQGTDFQLPDLATMRDGIPVIAAAAGTVRNIRDGVPDHGMEAWQRSAAVNAELGNAVAVVHADGSEALYGHLRNGSIVVRPGDTVTAGQKLGLVGLSGKTEFPHLHFQLMRDGRPIDPFTELPAAGGSCAHAGTAIWTRSALAALAYRPALLICGGFALMVPDRGAVLESCPQVTDAETDSAFVLLFAEIAGVQSGDRLRFTVRRPDGTSLIDNEITIERSQARHFRYVGKRRPAGGWPAGRYRAHIALSRAGDPGPRTLIDIQPVLDIR